MVGLEYSRTLKMDFRQNCSELISSLFSRRAQNQGSIIRALLRAMLILVASGYLASSHEPLWLAYKLRKLKLNPGRLGGKHVSRSGVTFSWELVFSFNVPTRDQ